MHHWHWYKPHSANQARGVSHFAQAVNSLVDIHELKRITTRTAKAQQMIALVLKGLAKKKSRGALGALGRAGDGNGETGSTAQDTAQLEKICGAAGAGIAYVDSEGDAKLVESNSPSPMIESYISDLLMRDATLAPGVPPEFFWNPSKLSSSNIRFILARADLFFQHVADALIYRFIDALVNRYMTWRIEAGLIAKPPDANWADTVRYRLPRRASVDNGRDNKARIEDLHNGLTNLRGCYDELGQDWRTETAQWLDEFDEFEAMCDERKLTPKQKEQRMARWRPLPPGSNAGDEPKPLEKPDGSEENSDAGEGESPKPEDLSARMDAYGVGVRAGAITPQQEDEAAFRASLGLPQITAPVAQAWQKDPARRPITLVPPGGAPPAQSAPSDSEEKDAA